MPEEKQDHKVKERKRGQSWKPPGHTLKKLQTGRKGWHEHRSVTPMVVPSKRRTYQEQGIGGPNQPPHSPTVSFLSGFQYIFLTSFILTLICLMNVCHHILWLFYTMLSLCFWDYLLPRLFVALVNFCLLISHCLLMDGNNKFFLQQHLLTH